MRSRACAMIFFAVVAALLTCELVPAAEPDDVSVLLEKIRVQHGIPALAACAVDEGKTVAIGAAGRRNVRKPLPVMTGDLWEIGSCTKSMTAAVAAMLVEDGKLRWDSTLGEVFPELRSTMHAAWREVRLDQLLVHRGGAPHDPPADLWKEAMAAQGPPLEQRLRLTTGLLAHRPAHPPGTRWEYSDCGYAMAGAMMERVAKEPWEELLQHRLFDPLGLRSAGFGPPAKAEDLTQPWGHRGDEAPYDPVPPSLDNACPPAIGPAATVHCSISDLAKYAAWHVAGARGEGTLLTPESFHKLHTAPEEQEYAMGWAVTRRNWAGGTTLMHVGETLTFYSVMWLGPGENTAFVAVANADNPEAADACNDAIRALINRY